MALLTLRDIGKIYVSEGNVSVGIRGVNLSFDRGEFVAVTGKSGSGKSTLLNVISGMDTYEEGELLIEGQSTSHFLQPDWEDYRQKYISFIFQDYNIIESYTVLQNVELALMHIDDKRERRNRAMELIRRVGLESHVNQKGSKLSGGQKQRTVIARALAKDSPIILADEPTGNLDSATSAEIINLLREVSRDKLLIVVTHNFEQVEHCATRHIRIFDGAVEFDHVLSPSNAPANPPSPEQKKPTKKKFSNLRNGMTLGTSMFTSRPKLSLFMCLLLIVGSLGVFVTTALSGEASALFDQNHMFNHIDGRVILTSQNGSILSDEELKQLVAEYGAEDYLHYDILLDEGTYAEYLSNSNSRMVLRYTYGEDYGTDIIGRYPQAKDEIFLLLPIAAQADYGKDSIRIETLSLENITFKVVGIKYFYDNNLDGKVLFTADGFRAITAAYCLASRANPKIQINLTFKSDEKSNVKIYDAWSVYPTFNTLEGGTVYISHDEYRRELERLKKADPSAEITTEVSFTTIYYNYNYDYSGGSTAKSFSKTFGATELTDINPGNIFVPSDKHFEVDGFGNISASIAEPVGITGIVIDADYLVTLADEFLGASYRQASLFFADDNAAYAAAERLRQNGYIAVPSDTTYTPDPWETILTTLGASLVALVWLAVVLFLAFLINLCSTRTLGSFKGDMAIMRSMGIPVKVIRIGMYVRMLIALIPAYLTVGVTAAVLYLTPQLNGRFSYLYAWQYALIFVGMLILTVHVTRKQIRKLFGESVKKALKGGASE